MAENDIYNSKARYENFKKNLELLTLLPKPRAKQNTTARTRIISLTSRGYLWYFKRLFMVFEEKDTSYIRRYRLLQTMKVICYSTEKDLAECEREDINSIVAYMHTVYKTPKIKADFIRDLKFLWRVLFTEKDERGRLDETLTPYVVRHLSAKIDKSKEKLRNDRINWEEFEKLLNYFSLDSRMQAYLFVALESLGRPQELLYTKIKDVELYDNYAKVYISEHGKEGTGFLQCIDSFPYLVKWLNQHPLKHDRNSFLFINKGTKEKYEQLKPKNVNFILRNALRHLGINKDVTAYSLKRKGVTFRRLRGDSDLEIQHVARWTSTKQLKTYDMSNQEDAFKIELIKRGLIKEDPNSKNIRPKIKICLFCNKHNGVTNITCENCNRPLDREKLKQQETIKETEFLQMKNELEELKNCNKSVNSLGEFFEAKQIQDLFKTVYKLQEEMKKWENECKKSFFGSVKKYLKIGKPTLELLDLPLRPERKQNFR